MFFTSKTHAVGYTDVFFGYELKGVCPLEFRINLGEAVQNSARFIHSLYTPELDVAFELVAQSRHISGLGPSLSLRARVSHHNSATALAKAQEVAKGLVAGLALWERLQWLPIDEGRYKQLFEGFTADSIWEISRRTQLLEFKLGLCTAESGRHGLAIYPFPPQQLNPFSRIMHILNRCKERVRLSVAIAPTRFSERELKFLHAQQEVFTTAADDDEDYPVTPYGAMALLGTSGIADFRRASSFLLRIYAASSEPVPAIIANSLGCALAAPAIPSDGMGGFKIQLLDDAVEKRIGETNLDNLRFNLPPFQAGTPWGRLPMIVPDVEAAAVFRFPTAPCPGLERVRRAAPFTGIPVTEGTLIGFASSSAADRTEVRLSADSRLRHVFICGQTGTGKSSLMLSMALEDIAAGHGLCLLDPHGDLYSRVLANIPAARRKDVIAFDCSQPEPGFSFNLLEHSSEGERDRIVEHFLEIFGQLFNLPLVGGPIFEMYFRCALTLVMCDPQATLADFMRFFQDRDYRHQCIGLCKDAFVTTAWEGIVVAAGGELRLENVAPYVVSKLSPFLFNRQTRGIVSCRKSTLDFDAAMRDRKILLVNLAKGSIGNLAASFIGMLFTEKILRAAMNPGNKTRAGNNFYLYADEFQTIATPGFAELLAEARKYSLGAVLAHQFLGQLPPSVLKAVLGNAANLLCMRVGPEDADLLAEYFESAFAKADLLSLPVGAAAASILSGGEKPLPFLLSTSNGLAQVADVVAVKQEEPLIDEKPAVCAKKTAKRSRVSLRQINPVPKRNG